MTKPKHRKLKWKIMKLKGWVFHFGQKNIIALGITLERNLSNVDISDAWFLKRDMVVFH